MFVPAMSPVRTAAPAAQPVPLADAKAYLRVDHSAEDGLIAGLIDAAIAHLDGWGGHLGRCLITQTWLQPVPAFPCGGIIRLPLPDVASASITYADAANIDQLLAPALTRLGNDVIGGFIELADGAEWPDTATRADAVRVTFTAGYGPAATDVPASIRSAILMIVGDLYRSRETTVNEKLRDNPTLDMLLRPHRVHQI